MKLKTRLMITFLAIIIMPILLTVLTYGVVRIVMRQNFRNLYGVEHVNLTLLSNPVEGFSELTEVEFAELRLLAETMPEQFTDEEFLAQTNESLLKKASCLIMMYDGVITYCGRELDEDVAAMLTRMSGTSDFGDHGYYIDKLDILVKKAHFIDAGGAEGCAFIVTTVRNIFSPGLFATMFGVILIILVVTSILLTRWIRDGAFIPLSHVNEAMRHIADGDFDYVMDIEGTGEIADLYENYNQMRLRLKESAEEKLQTDRQNRELISNITHDLKTPITSIRGYVEGIMDGVADTPEKMERYMKTIYNKANDLNRLINELTIYSGIDSNRIPYNFHKLNITEYFIVCVQEVGLDLESKNIKLNYTNTVDSDTYVIADPEQLKRVVDNIINNSVKYMNKTDGEIDIRLLDEIDSIRVEIEDNGKGVSPKEIGHIFERFYRTDASRNSLQGGSGIGLSIVKKIIEDHGGYIWATGKENEGICMHFVLRKYVQNMEAV